MTLSGAIPRNVLRLSDELTRLLKQYSGNLKKKRFRIIASKLIATHLIRVAIVACREQGGARFKFLDKLAELPRRQQDEVKRLISGVTKDVLSHVSGSRDAHQRASLRALLSEVLEIFYDDVAEVVSQ